MQKSIYLLFSLIFYISSWILLGYLLIVFPQIIKGNFYMDMSTIIKSGSVILIFLLAGTIFALSAIEQQPIKSKIIKFAIWSFTIIYIMSFFNLVFLTKHTLEIRLELTPFSNIFLSVYEFLSEGSNVKVPLFYLFYNILIYVPMGLLLYYFSEKLRKFNRYFITMFLLITISTIVQYFLGVNSLRVDDIILSLFGSIFTFMCVNKFYNYLKEEKNEEYKI